jgi:hypothetical protein
MPPHGDTHIPMGSMAISIVPTAAVLVHRESRHNEESGVAKGDAAMRGRPRHPKRTHAGGAPPGDKPERTHTDRKQKRHRARACPSSECLPSVALGLCCECSAPSLLAVCCVCVAWTVFFLLVAGAASDAAVHPNIGVSFKMASNKKFSSAEVKAPSVDFSDTRDDSVELWAIRCPPGFDASRLDGLSMGELGAEGDGFALAAAPSGGELAVLSAFPSAKKNRWLLGKGFARQFVVSVPPPPDAPSAMVQPEPLPPVPQKPGLRLRHSFPGGGGTPIESFAAPATTASSSRKRRADELGTSSTGTVAAEADKEGHRKQEKKAKKHKSKRPSTS